MCGMTRSVDVSYAVSLGVDAIGIVFYAKSLRCCSVEQAKTLLQGLPPFVSVVGVFVNASAAEVLAAQNALSLQCLQFHGDEGAEFCEQFETPYIKSVQVDSEQAIHTAMLLHPKARAILLETPQTTGYGGSGVAFDWRLIPKASPKPIILAGGLHPHSVKAAIDLCNPYAVDVCSGVESSPGVKDHAKMRAFTKQVWGIDDRT